MKADGISETDHLGIELPDLAGCADEQLEELERELLAAVAEIREERLERSKWSIEKGWSPETTINPSDVIEFELDGYMRDGVGRLPLDHLYHLRRDSRSHLFVSEPYELRIQHLLPLAIAAYLGRWDVRISAGLARWFPARSVAVLFVDKAPNFGQLGSKMMEAVIHVLSEESSGMPVPVADSEPSTQLTASVELRSRVETAARILEKWENQMPKTQIFKDGDQVSVVTNADEERDFVHGFTRAFSEAGGNGTNERDAEKMMMAAFEILARLRGYKAEVQEQRLIAAGRWPHPEQPAVAEHDDGETPVVEPDGGGE